MATGWWIGEVIFEAESQDLLMFLRPRDGDLTLLVMAKKNGLGSLGTFMYRSRESFGSDYPRLLHFLGLGDWPQSGMKTKTAIKPCTILSHCV